MAKDLTALYNKVVNGPEFKAFHKRVGDVINSGPVQIKQSEKRKIKILHHARKIIDMLFNSYSYHNGYNYLNDA